MKGHRRLALELFSFILVVTVLIGVLTVCDAHRCYDSYGYGEQIEPNEDDEHYCCKTKRYIDREELSQFYCEGGCCGDRNEEYCCAYINERRSLPYVIGFSIFGVVVVVVVSVIMFFVLRRACRGYRENKQHRKALKDVYMARHMQAMQSEIDPLPAEEGVVRIVHPITVMGEPDGDADQGHTDSMFTVAGPGQGQPQGAPSNGSHHSSASAGTRRHCDDYGQGQVGPHRDRSRPSP